MTIMFNYNKCNYAQDEKSNRFFMQGGDGRYVHISQRVYEEVFAKFLEETTEKIELEDDTNAIAKYTAEMTQEEAKEDAEDTQNTEAPLTLNQQIKEDTTMTTFTTLSGNTFTTNEQGNYFYMIDTNGKKIRIKKSEFEAAQRENEIERQMNSEALTPASDAKKTPKKAKKNTRKKKVQVGGFEFQEGEVHLILTPKQLDFLRRLSDSTFWQQGVQSTLWIDVLCDEITGQFEGKPMTVGAMVSTLREKGILAVALGRLENKKAKYIELTDLGQRVAVLIGIA